MMVEIVRFDKDVSNNCDEIVEYIRSMEKDGKINRLCLMIEDKDLVVYSKNINLRNKDFIHFLMHELMNYFRSSDCE